jgi:hypothetical protein
VCGQQGHQRVTCLDSGQRWCAFSWQQLIKPLALLLQIETAYDVLFMQSMKKRITGDIEVPTSVRFADVPTRKRSSSVSGEALEFGSQLLCPALTCLQLLLCTVRPSVCMYWHLHQVLLPQPVGLSGYVHSCVRVHVSMECCHNDRTCKVQC